MLVRYFLAELFEVVLRLVLEYGGWIEGFRFTFVLDRLKADVAFTLQPELNFSSVVPSHTGNQIRDTWKYAMQSFSQDEIGDVVWEDFPAKLHNPLLFEVV